LDKKEIAEIILSMERLARSLQSSIWILQNSLEDLNRLGSLIAKINKEIEKLNEDGEQ